MLTEAERIISAGTPTSVGDLSNVDHPGARMAADVAGRPIMKVGRQGYRRAEGGGDYRSRHASSRWTDVLRRVVLTDGRAITSELAATDGGR